MWKMSRGERTASDNTFFVTSFKTAVIDPHAFLLRIKNGLFAFLTYPIAGIFRRVQFSQMVNLYHFAGLIFTDVHTYAHYVLCNPTYFTGLIFAARRSSTKTTKTGPTKFSHYIYSVCISQY